MMASSPAGSSACQRLRNGEAWQVVIHVASPTLNVTSAKDSVDGVL
jgi:hypothetical protein